MSRLTIVNVAYPFAPVVPGAVGGAEQVLGMIDEALVEGGHRSVVVAASGSRCAGELAPVPAVAGRIQDDDRRRIHRVVKEVTDRVVREARPDLVHLHGVDFDAYLPGGATPVLATLHLPLSHYPRQALSPSRPRTWLNGVSAAQMRHAPAGMPRVRDVPNGVRLDRFAPALAARRRYALVLGRICPEKGIDVAIDAARSAGIPVLVAGRVFPFESHERYFRETVAPRLGPGCRFVGPVGPARRAHLLSRARCLLVASRVAETSSLVAMEALASGTAVVAMRVGALPEIVDEGRTGFLVDDVPGMANAIRRVDAIDPRACRLAAEARYDARRMIRSYLELYRELSCACPEDRVPCSA
ncbi:MAG: glycosyltransferase family 4 protein [Myxococcales bacterium]|nr:glycosyltransferase family 4 protein [Myxococcales bacterium]